MQDLKSLLKMINEAIAIDKNNMLYVKDDSDMSGENFLDDVILTRSGDKGSKITVSKVKIDSKVQASTIYFELDSTGKLSLKEKKLEGQPMHVRVYSSYRSTSHTTTGGAFDKVHSGLTLKNEPAPRTTKFIIPLVIEALEKLVNSKNNSNSLLAEFFIFLYFALYKKGKLIRDQQYKYGKPVSMLAIIRQNPSIYTLKEVYKLVINDSFKSTYSDTFHSIYGRQGDSTLSVISTKWNPNVSSSVRKNNPFVQDREIKSLFGILSKFGATNDEMVNYKKKRISLERISAFNIFKSMPAVLVKKIINVDEPLQSRFVSKKKKTKSRATPPAPDPARLRQGIERYNQIYRNPQGAQIFENDDEALNCINMLHRSASNFFSSDVKSVALNIAQMAKDPNGKIGNVKSSAKFATDVINETIEGLRSKIEAYDPEIIIVPESSSKFNIDFRKALIAKSFIKSDVEVISASKFTRFSNFRRKDAIRDKTTALAQRSQSERQKELVTYIRWLSNDWYANTYIKKLYALHLNREKFPEIENYTRGDDIKIHDVTPGGMMSSLRKYLDGFLRVVKIDPDGDLGPEDDVFEYLDEGEKFIGEKEFRYEVELLFHNMMGYVASQVSEWIGTLDGQPTVYDKRVKIAEVYDTISRDAKSQFEKILSKYLYENYKSPQLRIAPSYPDRDVDVHEEHSHDVYLESKLSLYVKIDDEFVYKDRGSVPSRTSGQAVKSNILQSIISTLQNILKKEHPGILNFGNNINDAKDFAMLTITASDYKEYTHDGEKITGSRALSEILEKYGFGSELLRTKSNIDFTTEIDSNELDNIVTVEYSSLVKTISKYQARYDSIVGSSQKIVDQMSEFAKKDMMADLPHFNEDFFSQASESKKILQSSLSLIAEKAFENIDGSQNAKRDALAQLSQLTKKIHVSSQNQSFVNNFINYLNKVPFLHDLQYGKPRIKRILIIDDNVATGGTVSIITRDILKTISRLEGMSGHEHECYTQHGIGAATSGHYLLKNILVITPFNI